jgi:hypothetical protein
MIKPNEGLLDRVIRISLGIAALAAGIFFLTGTAQVIAFFVAVAGIGTGVIGYCGLYSILKINTCPFKSKKEKDD